jgi:hypothetical protein
MTTLDDLIDSFAGSLRAADRPPRIGEPSTSTTHRPSFGMPHDRQVPKVGPSQFTRPHAEWYLAKVPSTRSPLTGQGAARPCGPWPPKPAKPVEDGGVDLKPLTIVPAGSSSSSPKGP